MYKNPCTQISLTQKMCVHVSSGWTRAWPVRLHATAQVDRSKVHMLLLRARIFFSTTDRRALARGPAARRPDRATEGARGRARGRVRGQGPGALAPGALAPAPASARPHESASWLTRVFFGSWVEFPQAIGVKGSAGFPGIRGRSVQSLWEGLTGSSQGCIPDSVAAASSFDAFFEELRERRAHWPADASRSGGKNTSGSIIYLLTPETRSQGSTGSVRVHCSCTQSYEIACAIFLVEKFIILGMIEKYFRTKVRKYLQYEGKLLLFLVHVRVQRREI